MRSPVAATIFDKVARGDRVAFEPLDSLAWEYVLMGGESTARRRRRSKPLKERSFPISKFGECVVICADGIKPGDWLARRINCTERHANLLIAGRRKPNARAILAINAELLADGAA